MAKPQHLDVYPLMQMQQLGSIVVVQPEWEGEVAGPSLTCDLETGNLAVAEHPPVEGGTPVYGVLGLLRLDAGPALVVVTGVEEVAVLRGCPVYRVASTSVLADSRSARWKAGDRALLGLLREGTDPAAHGGGMYLSYAGDLTLTQQRYEAARADPQYAATEAWHRAEPAFFWNRALARPLLEAGMGPFVPPVITGFVGQLRGLEFRDQFRSHSTTITLIARRSWRRAGCRQWRRGADADAAVANFVESEQLVGVDGGRVQASFVQVRGSVPLLWSQAPCLKYKIPIAIATPAKQDGVFGGHAGGLLEGYREVTAINLANQTGREGKLSAAYRDAAARFSESRSGFRLVGFDFHKQCGATNYARLSLLWQEVLADFKRYGYWFQDNAGTHSRQAGVFRTNCVDTLDRTNVVQGMLGRKQLEHVLARLGLMSEGASLPEAFPAVDTAFRVMWADHGDEISRQYAGTGAMKSAFTRTGKRDIWGLLDDGAKSLTRYYLNNFQDGRKQDAIDLVVGNFAVQPGKAPWAAPQGSPGLPLLAALTLVGLAASNARQLVHSEAGLLGQPGAAAREVAALLAAAALVLALMFRFGRLLVDAPRLRLDLVHPW